MRVSEFDFELPNELIASHPLDRRDASRMLVVDPKISDKHITDFVSYLRPGDVVVFNNSRVIPARFDAAANDGAKYEITLHTKTDDGWLGFAKKFQKLKSGEKLKLDDGTEIEILGKSDESGLTIKFYADDVFSVLDSVGKMPLPPYMKREEETSDRERYQTIYANPLGSMAAPTAGLHFTNELLDAVRLVGAEIVNITLHVGAGTWAPIKTEDTENHKMHSEWGVITQQQADIINNAKQNGGRIIAVGTTSLRLLESAAGKPFCGTTNIFITPGYKFKIVDVLLTNFHLPKSTLFMLVSAFAGLPEMRAAYAHAVSEKYRFFSYGDSCLLFRKDA
ncbi:MAG: tRNA preQ1(34) S-adenosylmethionine ribosyltransferase-isomerase QueA [Alphaproteobacteria bacterium]